MPLPERIPVKISSEAAGYVTMTPVIRQEISAGELMEHVVGLAGKDVGRIREILRQGSLVSGASRFRWEPMEVTREELAQLLQCFPDPRPDRPFDSAKCIRAALAGGRATIELTREAASQTRWFQRRSFWQALMETASRLPLVYQTYSYADRADLYRVKLPLDSVRSLQREARLLQYSSLEMQVREYSYDSLDLWVER